MRRRFICRGRRWIRLEFIFRRRRGIFMPNEFIASYRGILILLMQKHLVVSDGDSADAGGFHGQDAGVAGCARAGREREELAARVWHGKIVISGADATGLGNRRMSCGWRILRARLTTRRWRKISSMRLAWIRSRRSSTACGAGMRCGSRPDAMVATSIARTSDGHVNCFFANFAGLRGGVNPVQTPQEGVEISVKSKGEGKGFFLPFLGDVQAVKGVRHGDAITFTLPTITKGAVFWYEE